MEFKIGSLNLVAPLFLQNRNYGSRILKVNSFVQKK